MLSDNKNTSDEKNDEWNSSFSILGITQNIPTRDDIVAVHSLQNLSQYEIETMDRTHVLVALKQCKIVGSQWDDSKNTRELKSTLQDVVLNLNDMFVEKMELFVHHKELQPEVFNSYRETVIWALLSELDFNVLSVIDIIQTHDINSIFMFIYCLRRQFYGLDIETNVNILSYKDPISDKNLISLIKYCVYELQYCRENVLDAIAFVQCDTVDKVIAAIESHHTTGKTFPEMDAIPRYCEPYKLLGTDHPNQPAALAVLSVDNVFAHQSNSLHNSAAAHEVFGVNIRDVDVVGNVKNSFFNNAAPSRHQSSYDIDFDEGQDTDNEEEGVDKGFFNSTSGHLPAVSSYGTGHSDVEKWKLPVSDTHLYPPPSHPPPSEIQSPDMQSSPFQFGAENPKCKYDNWCSEKVQFKSIHMCGKVMDVVPIAPVCSLPAENDHHKLNDTAVTSTVVQRSSRTSSYDDSEWEFLSCNEGEVLYSADVDVADDAVDLAFSHSDSSEDSSAPQSATMPQQKKLLLSDAKEMLFSHSPMPTYKMKQVMWGVEEDENWKDTTRVNSTGASFDVTTWMTAPAPAVCADSSKQLDQITFEDVAVMDYGTVLWYLNKFKVPHSIMQTIEQLRNELMNFVVAANATWASDENANSRGSAAATIVPEEHRLVVSRLSQYEVEMMNREHIVLHLKQLQLFKTPDDNEKLTRDLRERLQEFLTMLLCDD